MEEDTARRIKLYGIARLLVDGDLSCEQYRAALNEDLCYRGDMRLLVDILAIDPAEHLSRVVRIRRSESAVMQLGPLTATELDALQGAANDETCAATAERLGQPLTTVQERRKSILRKLGVGHIGGAVAEGLRLELID